MCELFSMSGRLPAPVGFSLEQLARHGENAGPRDGWGVAFYDGRAVSLFREPYPVSDSALVQFIEQHAPPSSLVISHIRKATFGDRLLCNTHPFTRELAGREHIFAHNGNLTGIGQDADFALRHFRPIGDTDSELAFCNLLERLAGLWEQGSETIPALCDRLDIIAGFAADLRAFGPANFLYSDADILFAHADRRHQPDGEIRAPGLHFLTRSCREKAAVLTGGGVTMPAQEQDVILVASVPLTDEDWQPMAEGEIIALGAGQIIERRLPASGFVIP